MIPLSLSVWEIIRNNNLSRIPVYVKQKENITGMINFFDAVEADEKKESSIEKYINNIISIECNLNLQEAFYYLQSRKVAIARVVGTNGRNIGIVRLKDIIRTITGY